MAIDREKAASAIENYARKSIPQRNDAYGQFMYHAELLRRGHIGVHRKDLKTLPAKYQAVIKGLMG